MRILVADDESGARAKVKRFLLAHRDVEMVGEAEHGRQALELICELDPDLVFLDINMPGLDGFEVLQALDEARHPLVIFATAYSDRALRAFEFHAVDYLLKPFDRKRFAGALERARTRLDGRERVQANERVMRALADLVTAPRYPEQLLVADGNKIKVVACKDIDYIESAANYAVLHAKTGQSIMRGTLASLAGKLDPAKFCRIHRQFIVRLGAIAEIQPYNKGDMLLRLHNGSQLKLSRRYKEALFRLMGPMDTDT